MKPKYPYSGNARQRRTAHRLLELKKHENFLKTTVKPKAKVKK